MDGIVDELLTLINKQYYNTTCSQGMPSKYMQQINEEVRED